MVGCEACLESLLYRVYDIFKECTAPSAGVQNTVYNKVKDSRELCCVSDVSLVAGLVMWDEVAATKDWVESQLPDILKVGHFFLASSSSRNVSGAKRCVLTKGFQI